MEVGQRRRPASRFSALAIAGKPTTMMPLQKLVKSCRLISWVMTMTARLLERTVVLLLSSDASSDASTRSAGLSRDGAETAGVLFVVPDSNSSVCNSRDGRRSGVKDRMEHHVGFTT